MAKFCAISPLYAAANSAFSPRLNPNFRAERHIVRLKRTCQRGRDHLHLNTLGNFDVGHPCFGIHADDRTDNAAERDYFIARSKLPDVYVMILESPLLGKDHH